MELGEKLRLARQEAGLSQRQLCGDVVTRNMLSQIEHGTARPSLETLRVLAARLEKPVSYFLEEDAVVSPNLTRMEQAREAFREEDWDRVWMLLEGGTRDPVVRWEWGYLQCCAGLMLGQRALDRGQPILAREILEGMEPVCRTFVGLERQRLLLMGGIPGMDLQKIVEKLPDHDEELMLRAAAALEGKDPARAEQLLTAAQRREGARWNLLMGRALAEQAQYDRAAQCLLLAEPGYPRESRPLLEACFRELGDFKRAYEYACKGR